MKNKNKIRSLKAIIAALIIGGMAILGSSCASNEYESTEEELTTVMTIGNYEVPYEMYRYLALNYINEYDEGDKSVWEDAEKNKEYREEINENIEKSLKNSYAILMLADEYGVGIDSEPVKEAVDQAVKYYIESYGGDKEYKKTLEENYMNDSVFRFTLSVVQCEQQLYYKLIELGIIDDSDEAVNEALRSDDFIRVKQVLIKEDEGDSKEENLKKAKEVYERAMNGEDFDMLIKEYGEDIQMFNNPDGYYMTRYEYIEDFENAAFELEVGEISEVVDSFVGYSVIKRLEKEETYLTENYEKLRESYLASQFNRILNERISELELKPTDFYKTLDILELE